jgi:thiol-disulfide isomerase/thioredoxin
LNLTAHNLYIFPTSREKNTRRNSFQVIALIFVLLVHLSGCTEKKPQLPLQLQSGAYIILFNAGQIDIPARLRITEDRKWCFHNWNETILLDSISVTDSSFKIKMPLFNTELAGRILSDSTFEGVWNDFSRDKPYSVSFTGHKTSNAAISCDPHIEDDGNKTLYEATFSPGSKDESSKAIGVFYKKNNRLVGTFLTESGDYRYLQGDHTGNSIELSAFDGAHLFYFCANVVGDSLTDGKFYSGNHWQEDWVARVNSSATLRDPDSLTYVKKQNELFSFHALNLDGDTLLFDTSVFRNKVTIVQIFGSWCPNCTDESRFMKELFAAHKDKGLHIVPVAFERTPDFEVSKAAVIRQFEELGLTYPPFFGGAAGKGNAAKVFSQLNTISSFPTAVFIDKTGKVRKIHTGFYGPGTGDHYQKNTAELTEFVEILLGELGSSSQ